MNRWFALFLIILVYLPVSLDMTVLHIAAPTLVQELNLSAQQMLWVMDIYSLIMVTFILPMGILNDKIGFKKLILWGTGVFGIASLMIGFALTGWQLVLGRAVLAIGAAMITPAVLAGVKQSFKLEKERNFAFGVWSAVGGAAAALGPLIGGLVLEYTTWSFIFWINVPLALFVFVLIYYYIPTQSTHQIKEIQWFKIFIFALGILLLVYAFKSLLIHFNYLQVLMGMVGAICLYCFFKHQNMLEISLFPKIKSCFIIILISMFALVGFELLLAQELQFVYDYTPLEAGIFILPLILSASIGGLIAGFILNYLGYKWTAVLGLSLTAVIFWLMASMGFKFFFLILLGLGLEITLLSSTSQIMTLVKENQSGQAAAFEGIAYDLGAGLGIAIFGMAMNLLYQHYSVGDQASIVEIWKMTIEQKENAKQAFLKTHYIILNSSACLFALLMIWTLSTKHLRHNIT